VVAEVAALGSSAARLGSVLRWCGERDVRLIAQDLELDTATQASRVAVRALMAERGPVGGRPRVADRSELVARIWSCASRDRPPRRSPSS
jgi:hypothetical protein